VLHRLAFAALLSEDSTGAVIPLDEKLILSQFVSSRELLQRDPVNIGSSQATVSTFWLLGNPAFSLPGSAATSTRNRKWEALPGTQEELARIAAVCDEFNVPYQRIESEAASEESVKQISGAAPRVLHFATHGFFFPVQLVGEAARDERLEQARGRNYIAAEQHPLLRSGLILAGANTAWAGDTVAAQHEDGILTALEVSKLDLGQSELAVLSACETALGDLRTGEGVFGLQRAFRSAGVSALIMSLWKVPDRPTAEFMELFYRNWLTGMRKVDAMRSARRTLRERYSDPRIWAAFILIGE
jgi:CHAT domain-containing protein